MLTNPPIPTDFCVCNPISHILTMRSTPVLHSVLITNVKAVEATFSPEKALVGAFSMITNLCVDLRLIEALVFTVPALTAASAEAVPRSGNQFGTQKQ